MMLLAQQVDAARGGVALVGVVCVVCVFVVIGTLIGAAILMGACKLFNTMVHKPKTKNGVPMPDVGKAMGIIFATMILNVVLSLAIGFAIGAGTAMAGGNGRTAVITIQVISNSMAFFLLAGLLTAILPTSFGRAALVALLHYAIAIIIIVPILLVVLLAVSNLPGQ